MELYKYTGSVAVLTVRFGKAETVTLYDSYDDASLRFVWMFAVLWQSTSRKSRARTARSGT